MISARVAAVTTLLLGAAAGSRAEDLSAVAPAPRLGTCGMEAGGFRLPDSDGCLRISGVVAAEAAWSIAPATATLSRGGAVSRPAAGADLSRSRLGVGARLAADVHLPTELGPVGAYVSLRGGNGFLSDRAAH